MRIEGRLQNLFSVDFICDISQVEDHKIAVSCSGVIDLCSLIALPAHDFAYAFT